MTAPAVKISLKTGIHIVWNFTFVTHYIAFLHFDSIIIKFVLNLAVFIVTYSMLLQVQITFICTHIRMNFMCLLFLLLDPETGVEYMIRRGECVNVLPGILKKVQGQIWRVNTGRSDKFVYIF